MSERDKLEAEYIRFATEECDMQEERAVAKVKAARSTPQKNKRLHAIHEAHMALMSKQAQIEEFESNLVLTSEARPDHVTATTTAENVNFIANVNNCVFTIHCIPPCMLSCCCRS